MRSIPVAVLVAAAALSFAGAARAGDKPPPTLAPQDPRAAHAETDTNKDGQIDHEEFHHRVVDVFYFADTDKNGSLSPAEFQKLDDPTAFSAFDKDHNGSISMSEYESYRLIQFRQADTDGSGTLSVQELVDYVNK